MKLHSDYPSLTDTLDRDVLVRQFAEVAEKGDAPLVLGLHGDWGTGKTSILHQVEFSLSGKCSAQPDEAIEKTNIKPPDNDTRGCVKTVWFEAWRYQNEPVPVVALLHEMRTQLSLYFKATEAAKKGIAVAVRGALLSLEDLTKKIGFQASKVEQAGRDWEQAHFASVLPSNAIREQLEAAIDQLLSATAEAEGERRRVVVFVDDLDRCEPEAAFRLLEGLKLYLTLNNCVFILGMNQQIVEDAIAKQMQVKDEAERKQRAGAYLEKICQNIWRMPPVANPKQYLLSLLPQTVYRQWIDAALADVPCLPPNPRRLKGLANLLIRLESLLRRPRIGMATEEDVLLEVRLMLIVALFHQFHHDLFRHWQMHPDLWGRIQNWCRCVSPYQYATASLASLADDKDLVPTQLRDLVFELLKPLKRVSIVIHDSQSAIPKELRDDPTYVDPSDPTVCWAQPLVVAATRIGLGDPEETRMAIHRYVRGVPGSQQGAAK